MITLPPKTEFVPGRETGSLPSTACLSSTLKGNTGKVVKANGLCLIGQTVYIMYFSSLQDNDVTLERNKSVYVCMWGKGVRTAGV